MSVRQALVPEVIQTSAMDCGPAALKSILEGFGISASYGRLREACQTSVDGTSIDLIEEVATKLGVQAEQAIVPLDHFAVSIADLLPAILVVRDPAGHTHFVVAWSEHGGYVQVMDPALGRRWMSVDELVASAYVHRLPVPESDWRRFAGGREFLGRMRALHVRAGVEKSAEELVVEACADPSFRSLAALDAATRVLGSLTQADALSKADARARFLAHAYRAAKRSFDLGVEAALPRYAWSASPTTARAEGDERPCVSMAGAVIVRLGVNGVRDVVAAQRDLADLAPELQAAVTERSPRPFTRLLELVLLDGVGTPIFLTFGSIASGVVVTLLALLLRGLMDVGRHLALSEHRALAVLFVLVVASVMLALEVSTASGAMQLGRSLEVRLRMLFLGKIPKLGDRYFHSRPTSDMAQRAHAIHTVRELPLLSLRFIRALTELVATAIALVLLEPSSAPFILAAVSLSLAVPLATQTSLLERDLRLKSYYGTLSRFYLDGLLGLVAIRTHNAERALAREHEQALGEVRRAARDLLSASLGVETFDSLLGVGLASFLLFFFLGKAENPGAALLVVYWSLALPFCAQEVANTFRRYPAFRNLTLRLLEPLGAIEEENGVESPSPNGRRDLSSAEAVRVELADVTVQAAGNIILDRVSIRIEPGENVAIVGASGAGKSTLVGLLMGWQRPCSGTMLVDGAPLTGTCLARLRHETAWLDPAVQLWNRSLFDNLVYGAPPLPPPIAHLLERADLLSVMDHLPDGLESNLGEAGGLVSGGEGQRIRFARALHRPDSRLVILDEPFRGLDRDRRRELLRRARREWSRATLLCITHDVGETADFARVLVVEDGRIVEDGAPSDLRTRPGSRYRALLDAEETLRTAVWDEGRCFRRLELVEGRLREKVATR